jgi:hypothetical protein
MGLCAQDLSATPFPHPGKILIGRWCVAVSSTIREPVGVGQLSNPSAN